MDKEIYNPENNKEAKINALFQKMKNSFEDVNINQQEAGMIFDDTYSDYPDDEKITLRDGQGNKRYEVIEKDGETSCEQVKKSFSPRDKHQHIIDILNMISLDFQSPNQMAAINRLMRHPKIADILEIKGSEFKKDLETLLELKKQE
jgi:hypothetical protein